MNARAERHDVDPGATPDRADCAVAARALFSDGPLVRRLMQHGRPYICPFERVIDAVPSNASVLDAGCGNGLLLGLLAYFGRLRRGLGFDASGAAIAMADAMRTRLPQPALLAFERRDASSPWPDGRYDAVTIIDLLHHVPASAQRAVLSQAAQRVTPGGVLVFKDMVDRPRWRALVSQVHDLVVARQRIHLVPFSAVQSVLEASGLRLVRHETLTTGPYRHELGVFQRPLVPPSTHRIQQ